MARLGRAAIVLLAFAFAFGVASAALANTFKHHEDRSDLLAKREDSDTTLVLVDDDHDPNDPTWNTVHDPTHHTVHDPTHHTVHDPTHHTADTDF